MIEFLRQYRIGGYAIFDFVASFLVALILAPLLSKGFKKVGISVPTVNWIYLVIPLGFVAHLLFGSITPMTRDLLDFRSHYIIKIIFLLLLYMGLRGIKRI